MATGKILLFTALGVGAVLLLTSERARNIRKDLEDKAKDNADKWKDKLSNMSTTANKKLGKLRDLLSDEVEGLGYDARNKIENILNDVSEKTDKMKAKMA